MFSREHTNPSHESPRRPRRRRAFTVIELLIVVGIIALLVGILLVALGTARQSALKGETRAVLNQFASAAQQFQLEHGRYPGVIPDRVLANDNNGSDGGPQISNMENALLEMMGGYRVLAPTDVPGSDADTEYMNYTGTELTFDDGGSQWLLKIDLDRIGEGPVIDGKAFAPYFTPDEGTLRTSAGQLNEGALALPDLVDSWGMPIVYLRQSRSVGPLFVAGEAGDPFTPQFLRAGAINYINATALGELGIDQTGVQGSILNLDPVAGWANAVGHGAIAGQSRGGLMVLSAGPDGFYFSRVDGPGSQDTPTVVGDLATFQPTDMDEYDDIRIFGGG